MNKRSALTRILLVLLLSATLLTASLAYAQEETPSEPTAAETAEAPTGGVTTLVLLIGLGAVVVVGGLMYARNNFKQS